jgi:hypothetical protein
MQDPPPVETLLQQFAAFADRLAEALADPVIDWQCRPAAGEWCLTEVSCHLRDVEREVHQPRFRALIANDNAFLSGAVADSWVEERNYREQSGPKALAEFLNAREESIELLSNLEQHYWQRKGQHTFFGPTTMHELLNLAVQHDAAHWEQVLELLAL